MSNLNYNNPLTSNQISAQQSVPVNSVFGISYSVLNTGGFMEVYNLSDLKFNYIGGTGLITGSTIPVNFSKGTNTTFNPDVLTLSNDNISSGRRRLGMLAFVQETGLIYQFTIPNYDSLWSSVTAQTGNSAVTFTQFATLVNNRSQAGQNFINAWTASTIDGYDAEYSGATWRVFPGSYPAITGGTYFSATSTLELYNSTGGTIDITGITASNQGNSNLSVGSDGDFQYSGITGMTFSGATVTDLGSGNVLITITGATGGTSGTSGSSGTSGTSGESGTSGSSGTSGIDGSSGTSGINGSSGTSGINGTSGTSGS